MSMNDVKTSHIEWVKMLPMDKVKCPLLISGVPSLKLKELLALGFELKDMPLYGKPKDAYGPVRLKEAVGEYYGVRPDNIALVSGANMGIYMAFAALVKSGDEVIIELPSYDPIRRAAASVGARIKYLHRPIEHNCQPDPMELKRLITKRTKLVFITTLHNPSGVRLDEGVLRQMLRICEQHGVYLVCDEIYQDFLVVQGVLKRKLAPVCTRSPMAVTISSLTKVYGLGLMRAGWLMAEPKLARKILLVYDHMTATDSYPAQMIALFCLRRINRLIDRTRQLVGDNLQIVKDWLAETGLPCIMPEAGIISYLRLPKGLDSWQFVQRLYKRYDTLAVPGEFFGTPGYIRLGFGVKEPVLRAGLKRITKCLDEMV